VGIVLGTFRLNTKNTGEELRKDECPRAGLWRYEANGSESTSCQILGLLLFGSQPLVSANILLLILLDASEKIYILFYVHYFSFVLSPQIAVYCNVGGLQTSAEDVMNISKYLA
jgi:hypothetical protein